MAKISCRFAGVQYKGTERECQPLDAPNFSAIIFCMVNTLLERELIELQEHICFLAAANERLRQENERLRAMLQRNNYEQPLDSPVDIRVSVLSSGTGIQLHPGVT